MKTGKPDRRVKYTISLLKDALVQLLLREHISKISVKELCELADVNRSTFYSHFRDQYDLLHHVEREVIGNVKSYLSRQDFGEERSLSFQVLSSILEYIKGDADLFMALLSDNYGSDIQVEIMELTEIISYQTYAGFDEKLKGYLTVFGISGCVSILQKWLQDGTSESTTEIAELILQILYKGLESFQ